VNQTPVIRVKNISKSFPPTRALAHVDMEVNAGEIRGLIGENGSGKSTLSAIISGNLPADEGEMFLFGQPFAPANSYAASEQGVTMIVQEQGTIETISVAANIFSGRENQFVNFGFLNSKKLSAAAQELLDGLGLNDIHADCLVSDLSIEDRKLVEIARAFYKLPELFIVDETTTALPQKGRNILYGLIKKLKDAGKSVLFISHDIEELISVCDTVTILRDGVVITTLSEAEMDPQRMKALMVGREVLDNYYRSNEDPAPKSEKVVLSVQGVSEGLLSDVSFELREGEILGFAGLSDCGMHELAKVIFGLTKPAKGKVTTGNGRRITNSRIAIREKMGFMSKNRDRESILITLSIKENIVLPSLPRLRKAGFFITPASEKNLAKDWCGKLSVKMRDIDQSCAELSGGNKQKVVLGKWLGNESNIFILDCPTRGIDVGVKEAIYRIIEDLKNEGKSIIMISEELPEILGMSDRILTMKDGQITHSFTRSSDLKEADIIHYMI
jgi:ribose transport system ATP-binding protein